MNVLSSLRRRGVARGFSPAIVLLLVALGIATVRAEIIERVLVKVNGDILTQTDLEGRQSAAIRARKENPQTMTNAELSKALAEVTPQIIMDAVDELLLLQRGKELGYRLSEEKFKQVLDNIKKENKLENEEQFQGALKAEGMTMAELRERLEKSMIIQQVQGNEVLGKISISESEAKAYYEAHKPEFTTPATMMLREILIAVPTMAQGFSVGQDEAAKAKADALYARLVAGDSFEKAVTEMSEAASKANGGLIGPISLSDVVPTLRQILEPLKGGQMTPVVRTQSGYQIFKVDTLNEAKLLAWDQAREEIGNRVAGTKQAAEFLKYMQKLRGQAVIDWKVPELKKLFDQKVAEEAKATVNSAPPPK
jgi:peptidyl-prolyl cis-trans isomerase SurA